MRKKTASRPILPACLLVAGRPCLVVGGGQIATRKAGHLLDAEADITVVASTVTEALRELAASGRLRIIARNFSASDITGQYLVFAATDDEDVNRQVIAACRKSGILCSAVDSCWTEGDFVTPAICRKNGLVVTVSTGGRSCRQSRMVKERIAQMLDAMTEEASMEEKNDAK
jgi:precorrin-2 dehydrogenase/sirohydrochlorin ferrochelatase